MSIARDRPFAARLAAWALVLPYLVGYVRAPDGQDTYLRSGEVGLGAMCVVTLIAVARGTVPGWAVARVYVLSVSLAALTAIYSLRWHTYPVPAPYFNLALASCAYLVSAVAYASIFYDRDILIDTFWQAGRIAMTVALAAFLLNVVGGPAWLVHTQYGTPRLQGLVSEPSAWAPALGVLMLLALYRRSIVDSVLVLLAGAATKSPIVVAVIVVSLLVFYLIHSSSWSKRIILGLLSVALVAISLHYVNPLNSPDPESLFDQTIGRLVSGISNITSGGTLGTNARYASSTETIAEVQAQGWLITGMGPGGAEAYFAAKNGPFGIQPNSFLIVVLEDFGPLGAALLVALLALSVKGLRRDPLASRVFLPFIVASIVNSAEGWEMYKFVAVGVSVLSLGWRPHSVNSPTWAHPEVPLPMARLTTREE